MDPDRSHDDVGLSLCVSRQRLGHSPDMIGDNGRSIGEVVSEEIGNRIRKDCGYYARDEQGADDMTCGVSCVTREDCAQRMGRR